MGARPQTRGATAKRLRTTLEKKAKKDGGRASENRKWKKKKSKTAHPHPIYKSGDFQNCEGKAKNAT